MRTSLLPTFFVVALLAGASAFAKKTPLTPELVTPEGYYRYEYAALLPEKDGKEVVKEVIKSTMNKKDAFNNLITFIVLNKYAIILEREDKVIFSVKKDVGKELVRTPVNAFERSQSEITFTVAVDYSDGDYSYMVTNIDVNKRLLKVDADYISIAPPKDVEHLRVTAIDITGLNIATKGTINSVNRQRISALVAERNGYVNLVIKERKTLSKLKDKYIEKIRDMDSGIVKEINIYRSEYECIMNFIAEFKKSVFEN